ncbi:MAG: hypothetical protein EPO23_06195 [Xanthobacteraceae bacterium]|nr:MAG: hypothetical protein EPO23_06195 [Xanthobacteraceae bacterium]
MPVFTFEKLSGPIRRAGGAIASGERRGMVGRLLDRFAESRLRRAERDINRAKRMIGTRSGK